MTSFVITGGQALHGTLTTPGSKNAVLPLLAATVLFDAPVTLTNVPDILDVEVMLDILRALGKRVTRDGDTLEIIPAGLQLTTVPGDLARRVRASLLFLGPILARQGSVELTQPGGDLIGRRPFDYHTRSLTQMGATFNEQVDSITGSGQLRAADIFLEEPSVTGTENLIMAAGLAHGTTVLRNVAQEQHVQSLCQMLAKAGLEITGIGTTTLTITGRAGQPFDQSTTWRIPPDELDAGTFAIAAVLTDGDITINDFPADVLRPVTDKLTQIGASIEKLDDTCYRFRRARPLEPFKVRVGFAPGFPTDLQPPMAVLATQAAGASLIHDWIYERRFGYADDLSKFGANITLCDPHRILVAGPTPLTGRRIYSLDIRAGSAFVLAALIAEGTSHIDHADIVERGYMNLDERLRSLGAKIRKESP